MTQAVKYESVGSWIETLGTVKHELSRWAQSAYLGEIATGAFTVNDPDGTAGHSSDGIVGLKTIRVTQSAAPAGNQYIYTGFVGPRKYRRGEDVGIIGVACEIDVTVQDINAIAGFDAFNPSTVVGTEGNRPSETVGARITWLLASGYLDAGDEGLVVYPTQVMDRADYANRTPADVLADCVMAVGFNWFIRWNGTVLGSELAFYNANTSTLDTSSLKISNAGDDNGTTIFAPAIDVELNRDPSRVASKINYQYASGTVPVERAATAIAFARRKHIASNSDVKTAGVALIQADRLLVENSTEEDQLGPITIWVPAAHVNDALAGQRIQVKFTHLRGYTAYTWVRILRRTVSQPQVGTDVGGANEDWYQLVLDVSPQEGFVAACSDGDTPHGTYYPLGGSGSYARATTSSDISYYSRPGLAAPTTPTPGWSGSWNFGLMGAGGVGTIDYGGDCVQNSLRFILVGNGTLTIQTERYLGSIRGFDVYVTNPYTGVATYVGAYNSGDAVAVVISGVASPTCVRYIDLQGFGGDGHGGCGSKLGWSSAVWS